MTVLTTQMHIVTFLITVFESVMFFFFSIYYLSRPSDKGRLWYLILLFFLIQYNIMSGLFPDEGIAIPIQIQTILAYLGGISVSMFFVYYIYKAFNLEKLKFYAIQGSIWFLFLPFIILFTVPYMITGDLDLSRRMVVVVPFIFTIFYVYAVSKSLWKRYQEKLNTIDREEIIGVYISVLLWATLPIIVYFDGSQLIENGTTNAGFMIMSVLFVRSAIIKSREDYNLILKSQKELKKSNHTLQKKVEERTKQLNEANDKRVNAFINLVHETKTPLTLINNYLDEFIEKHGSSEEMEITKVNMDKLTRNMTNYFDMYKINKGVPIYDHDQIADFSGMLADDLTLFHSWAKQKNIQINQSIEPGVTVKADPEAINRVINNLLDNAIKYTGSEGTIGVELYQRNGKICFKVRDNGMGIAEENQKHIFEPYYQSNRRKSNVQGIGLGLSLVKITVDNLGGGIELKSTEELGTMIEITLPASLQNEATSNTAKTKDVIQRQKVLNIKEEEFISGYPTILVVEDKVDLLRYLHQKLNEDYNVFVASNGIEAINKLKTIPKPDLIISDVMMDDMDGYELLEALRSQEKYHHIPFIFLTAKSTKEDKLKGLTLGAMDFISKPFEFSELKFKIAAILANNKNQKLDLIHQASNSVKNGQTVPKNMNSLEYKCKEFMLTERETEIVKLTIQGKTYNESGELLHISSKTVSKHLSNIYGKLGLKGKMELIQKLDSTS